MKLKTEFTTAFVLLCLALLGCTATRNLGGGSAPPAQNVESLSLYDVETTIIDGDEAFSRYKYEEALKFYKEADRKLIRLREYETEAPSADTHQLQRCYNIETLLLTRIDLTEIALNIRRIKEKP
jgi:hypothetical protein